MATYKVQFSIEAKKYRIELLKYIDNLEICEFPNDDEILIKCNDDAVECVEYELRKAKRRDGYCKWEKIN